MAGVYKGLTIKFGADTHKLSEALNEIDDDVKKLKSNLRKASNALKLDPKNTELVSQKYKYLGEQITLNEKKLKELQEAEKQLGREKLGEEGWNTLQREISATEAKIKSAKAELSSFVIEQKAANSKLGVAGAKLSEWGDALTPISRKTQSIGRGLTTGLTLPLVAVGGASVAAAVQIDSALTGVKKTVNATEEEYIALKDSAIEYSKTNAISATDILAAEELGGQLGVAKENLEAFAKVTTGLDIATNMNVEAASTNMARFMNVTKNSADTTKSAADQYVAYGNTVVGLGNNLATTESEISDFSLRMASAASLAGMSQADILGIGGAMSSLGLEAEAGGTAFSNTITMISMAVSEGGEELQGFTQIAGMSADEFASKWKTNATEAFIDFINGLAAGKEAGEDMNVVLDELGITGIRQSDAIRRLAGNTDLLSNAVKLANDQWRDGSALNDEVANRNESLASKFEMVKNRIIAVADDIGAPVADAMLAALDAAEPLFEAIENGARTFSEMSEGQQQVVIQTLAIIACLGPALSLFGKAAGSVKALGGALTTLSKFSATASIALGKKIPQGASQGAAAVAKMSAQAKLASVGMTALKGAAVGLAVAGIAVLVSAISDYLRDQERLNKATEGLKDSITILDGPLDTQASSFDNSAASARDARDAVNELIESQAALAEDIADKFSDTMADASLAKEYADRIKYLTENFDGSAESLAELQAAIDGYNSVTGDSIGIIDAENGKISVSTDQLLANTDAWIANAKAKAAQEAYQDTFKKQIEAEQKLEAARSARESYEQKFDEEVKNGGNPGIYGLSQLESLRGAERDAEEALRSAEEATADLGETTSRYTLEAQLASQKADDFRKALEGSGQEASSFDVAAEALNTSVDDLAAQLSSAGISAEQFAQIGAGTFAALRSKAGMDISAIMTLFDSLNAQQLDPKQLTVNDDGTISYAGQQIQDLNALDVANKNYTVNDDGSISFQDVELSKLGLVKIDDKIYKVTDNGSAEAMQRAAKGVKDWLDKIPPTKTTTVTAETSQAESALSRVAGLVGRVAGKVTATLSAGWSAITGGSAKGGIALKPIQIPKHAAGGIAGIVSQATLTNQGWVGEDGTEAIVPLDNKRYVRPFAGAVASQIDLTPVTLSNGEIVAELSALRSDIKGLKLEMDGQRVGKVITPYVNENLGAERTRVGRGF